MAIIAQSLSKIFILPNRQPGLKGALRHIVKPEYTEKVAVDSVNFQIDDGEAVAYIGPNGAGKSTTIKMLTGILYPTSGGIEIEGLDPFKDRIANTRNIGVVFGQRTQLWWDIPVEESFRLLKDIYEIPDPRYQENIKLFREIFGLSEFISRPARKLSLGQRMRADLAAAMLHDPKVLYLDEPTIGLDIAVKEGMREFIQHINRERGTTIILTSHDLSDVEDLCRRVIVIDKGKIICDSEISCLAQLYACERAVRIILKQSNDDLIEYLSAIPSVVCETEDRRVFTITFNPQNHTAYEIIHLVGEKVEVQDINLIEPDIKKVIERIYRSELQVNGA